MLLAAARAIARDEAEAEDLVQTTFERALRAAPTIRDPRAIRAWLLTVQTREALRVVRRLRRIVRLDPTVHELPLRGPEMSGSVELDEALGQLSRPIRAAVVLHHMVGLSVRETADALGVTENTAKARLATGLARLRGCSMKTEPTRDSAVEIGEERWRAEPGHDAEVRTPRPRRPWRSTAFAGAAIVALLVALAVVYVRPGDGSKSPSIPRVALGFDGIPNQIDGQRVYRLGEQAEWQKLTGSFLLGSSPGFFLMACPPGSHMADAASADLVAFCSGYQLISPARTTGSGGTEGRYLVAAPRGSGVFGPWDGRLVIARVHTHDPEAAGCNEAMRAECDAAVVAEEVIWPIVPMEFNDERVFRAADSATYSTFSHSFLFGGIVAYDNTAPCGPADEPSAQQKLAPYCHSNSVDGVPIAEAGGFHPVGDSKVIGGSIAVVRAHVNDPLSAGCPSDVRWQCAAAIVVESILWSYDPYAAPYAINPRTSAQVGPSVGPIGPDGIPLDIDGRHVYSSSTGLPLDAGFLLGGRAAPAESCPTDLPSPNQDRANSSACGHWLVGGAPVNVLDGISPSLKGKLVVVDVVRTRVLTTCATSSLCGPSDVLVVTSVVWAESSAQGTPTPGAP
jgi:RNA polymerase sigma-70 factor (ECF subfamily)